MVAVAHGLLPTTTTHRLSDPVLVSIHKSLDIVGSSSSDQRSTSSSVVRIAREALLNLGESTTRKHVSGAVARRLER
jgi:hypothetical protein